MSYESVLEGLHERFQTISGLAAILNYEPTSIQTYPTLYSMLDDFEVARSGQVVAIRYRILHRLLFRWQHNEQALAEMAPFVNDIIDAVGADPHLGGRLTAGYSEIVDGETMFVVIGGTECLALDVYSSTLEK